MSRAAIEAHAAEMHYVSRSGWLRAAVLGANDGILSIASILTGVAAGDGTRSVLLLAGLAGLIAGATSMATGEYVSVQSQADIERGDLKREKRELKHNAEHELNELAHIYEGRGLDKDLAHAVAVQLTAHDALGAHARDELGITDELSANPLQAAFASASSFLVGGALPLLLAALAPEAVRLPAIVASAILGLLILGATGAVAGGVPIYRPMMRVFLWGIVSMALSAMVGHWTKLLM